MRRRANGSFNIEINTANDEAFDALGDDVAADDEAGNEKISFEGTVWKLVDFSYHLQFYVKSLLKMFNFEKC